MLHYNIIVLAESPPLLTVPATGFSQARAAARGHPCMHFHDAWSHGRFYPAATDISPPFSRRPGSVGLGQKRPGRRAGLRSWQCEDVVGRQPHGTGADAGIPDRRARYPSSGESHGEYCRHDSTQRSQVTHKVRATRLRTRSSSGERTLVGARFQSCGRVVVVRRIGSACLATPQPLGVRQ